MNLDDVIKPLNEGTIKVPDYINKKILNYLKGAIDQITYDLFPSEQKFLHDELDSSEYLFGDNVDPSRNLLEKLKDNEKPVAYTIPYNLEDVAYTQTTGIDDIKFMMVYWPNREQTVGFQGMDTHDNIVVGVNLSKLIDSLQYIYTFAMSGEFKKYSKDEQVEEFKIMGYDEMIGSAVKSFLQNAISTIRHETVHAFQQKYLKDKHPKQVETPKGDSMEDYFDSEIEFSPHIVGAISDFKEYMKALREYLSSKNVQSEIPKEYKIGLFYKMIGESSKSPHITDYVDEDVSIDKEIHLRQNLISPNIAFYKALKSKNRKKWKKAVKYTYNELSEVIK